MTERLLRAQPLSAEAFAPFGQVIGQLGTGELRRVNEGSADRWDWQARCESSRAGAAANLAVFHAQPRPMPFTIELLERHPCSSQLFLPLGAARYVVVVASSADAPGAPPADLYAFYTDKPLGINYAPGTWHHSLLVLDAPASFACLVWEDGSVRDCEVQRLQSAQRAQLISPW